jgi:tetraacyldisaccharide 4'-kinase
MQPAIHGFSLLHRMGSRLRRILYDTALRSPAKAPLTVLSVGSLGFGGSEKTPLAQELLRFLLQIGLKPALVTRGYRGRWERKGGILSEGKVLQGGWRDSGDEPFMIARNLPRVGVYVGRNRLASCRRAQAAGFQVAVLDDGFQHLQLQRDLDLVLFDPGEKIRLRESHAALKRAHVILLKEGIEDSEKEIVKRRYPRARIFVYRVEDQGLYSSQNHQPVEPDALTERPILAFCGIARPERFFTMLQSRGLDPVRRLIFADHHPYPPASLDRIRATLSAARADAAVTTEKDSIKLNAWEPESAVPMYYIKIGLKLDELFYDYISTCLAPLVRA